MKKILFIYLKKYHLCGNLKFNYSGTFQSLKLCIFMKKILFIYLKKYHPCGNLKFNYLGTFQSLKSRILMDKNPSHLS